MNDSIEDIADRQFYQDVCKRAQVLLEDIQWELEETGAVSEDTHARLERHLQMYAIDRNSSTFKKHLEKTVEEVQEWPERKRNIKLPHL